MEEIVHTTYNSHEGEQTMSNQERTSKNMTIARIVGALFLTATVTYMLGDGLLQSILSAPDFLLNVYSNSSQVVLSVLITFVAATANVAIGVLLFPILKKHNEPIALGYLVTRIFDGGGLLVSGIGILSLIPLSRAAIQAGTQSAPHSLALGNMVLAGSDIAFVVTMIALGLGAMPFCYLLYQSRLIPRALAVLGFMGYVALAIGSSLELFGHNLAMIHYVPGGLFEFILPLWLIVKGFNSPAGSASAERVERDKIGYSQA